jgi:DNA-binding transcriptional ArsR family regulator
MGLEWWQLFYWSNAELKRSHDALVKLHFPDAVHSGALSVEKAAKWLADWRERRRSFAHRLRMQLPDLDWELLDAALSYESPAEGMTMAQGRLGAEFGVDQSTVSRHLTPFVEAGVLKSETRSRKGYFAKQAGPGRTSNSYRLDTGRIALLLKAVRAKAKDITARTKRRAMGSWGPQEWSEWGEKLMAESPDRVRHGLSPPDAKAEPEAKRKAFVKQANLSTFPPRNDGSYLWRGDLAELIRKRAGDEAAAAYLARARTTAEPPDWGTFDATSQGGGDGTMGSTETRTKLVYTVKRSSQNPPQGQWASSTPGDTG